MRRLVLPLGLLHAPDFRGISEVLVTESHAHPLSAVDHLLDSLLVRDLAHVSIVLYFELAAQVLGPDKLSASSQLASPISQREREKDLIYRQEYHISVNTAHEDADDLAVVVTWRRLSLGRD